MSSLDQYSYCPCGNGKKIKFCKCNQHFAEMEKIHRMIVGEQNVAALDRINADLKTMPSEPWLLAMKCELLLQLRELEALEETSAKFIRLQPDNALAKLYRSLLAVIRGNTEEGATLLLQAIGDSTENLPPMTATVSLNLLETMAQRGLSLPALLHAEMLMDMGDEMAKYGYQAHSSLTSQNNTNVLSRESLPSAIDAEDSPYSERLIEAEALIGAYRISVAKTKLESMLREFGPQAPVLQHLLYCQLMLSDVDGAGASCRKLALIDSLTEPQRIYYHALAYELAPKSSGVGIQEELCQYSIEDTSFEEKLTSNPRLVPIPVDQLKGLLTALLNEEVPPKSCFVCVDHVLREQFGELEASRTGAWIAYYGRQTDKPARLITLEPPTGPRRLLLENLKQEIGLASLPRELVEKLPTSYLSQVTASVLVKKQVPPERAVAFRDATRQLVVDSFLDYPLECLGNKTPREASSDPKSRIPLSALLLHWQGSGSAGLNDSYYKSLHQQLNLTQPLLEASQDVFDLVGGAAYFWTNLATIDADSLIQLMQSALTRGVASVTEELVRRSEQMQWPDHLKESAEYTQLNMKAQLATDPNDAEKLLLRIAELAKKIGVPIGNAVLERVEMLNSLGRGTEGRMYLEKSLRENPDDPVLLQFIQMAMMREQQMRSRGGSPQGAGMGVEGQVTPSSSNSSGLWTPDQGTSGEDAPSSGGSKLWIPGQ